MSETSLLKTSESQKLGVSSFYGNSVHNHRSKVSKKNQVIKTLPRRLNNLLGPTQVWKVFQRQSDALAFAKIRRNGVMTFAFQHWGGTRSFLVAHPQVFWHYDVQKDTFQRCTYEVIPESTACKLYFDLEFDMEFNPNKSGTSVVDIFINVVLYFLSKSLNINATREDVLNLDSSTNKKFSRHLIFQLNSYAFCNNKCVGEFVHFMCKKLQCYLTAYDNEEDVSYSNKDQNVCTCCQLPEYKNTVCVEGIGFSPDSLKSLFVLNRKGNKVLICDESVYSRNRHFRLFQNTKWTKNSPLVLSEDNLYKPLLKPNNKSDEISLEQMFLDSLVSYIACQEKNFNDIKVVHFKHPLSLNSNKQTDKDLHGTPVQNSLVNFSISPYPEIDNFISTVVSPGHIWRNIYFCSSSVIVYDIVGNRYCQNIGRSHRSNNVKYIVNLEDYTYYQKCHDPECFSFRSRSLPLPPEVKFKLEDDCYNICDIKESSECTDDFTISDSDLMEVANVIEDLSSIHSEL